MNVRVPQTIPNLLNHARCGDAFDRQQLHERREAAGNKIVLDASALLAVLNRELGADKLTPEMLSTATSRRVNLVEVQDKLVNLGLAPGDAWEATLSPIREATAFIVEHAEAAGNLITKIRPLGLSLRDRACLALGIILKAPVYTADKSWKELKLGVPIHLTR